MKEPKNNSAPAAQNAAPIITPEVKAKLAEWLSIKEWQKKGAEREKELRRELAAYFVPTPKEGTNNVLGEGYAVKVGHSITRKLDESALDAVMPQLPEDFRVIGNLISYKPTFSLDVYRSMSPETKKIFEQALTITETETPSLEIILAEAAPTPEPVKAAPVVAKAKPVKKPSPAKSKPAAPAKKPAAVSKPKKGGKSRK